jgi:hypothetical protein
MNCIWDNKQVIYGLVCGAISIFYFIFIYFRHEGTFDYFKILCFITSLVSYI